MKYLLFWEYKPEDIAKVVEKTLQSQAMEEKMTDSERQKWPTIIFPPHHMGHCKGFSIVEATDSTQIERSMTYWFPEIAQQYVPIVDNTELLKIYQEMAK